MLILYYYFFDFLCSRIIWRVIFVNEKNTGSEKGIVQWYRVHDLQEFVKLKTSRIKIVYCAIWATHY